MKWFSFLLILILSCTVLLAGVHGQSNGLPSSLLEEPENLSSQNFEVEQQSSLSDEVQPELPGDDVGSLMEFDELPEDGLVDGEEAPAGLASLEQEDEIEGKFNRGDVEDDLDEDENDLAMNDNEASLDESLEGRDDAYSPRHDMHGLSVKPVDQISLSTQPLLPVPTMQQLPASRFAPQPVTLKVYQWQADNVGYRNLIFEEPALERHGHVLPGQSIRSGIKFIGRAAFYPADLIKGHNRRCDNPLGWSQPGTCPR